MMHRHRRALAALLSPNALPPAPRRRLAAQPMAALVAAIVACASGRGTSAPAPATAPAGDSGLAVLRARPGVRLGHPPRDALRNANGSPRIASDSDYAAFWRRVAPSLQRWASDPRLAVDPNYVAALLMKESGADSLAVSAAPALGLAQLTARADADLRLMTTEYHFQWMRAEVDRWPRAPMVHDSSPTRAAIESALARGTLSSRDEYLFDPLASARAAVFWIRLLENKWTTDLWPGGYGTFARRKLNGGKPLTEEQLFDLVTVSYNRGYLQVRQLVDEYGAAWTAHLGELGAGGAEASDYLERVRSYAATFARAARE